MVVLLLTLAASASADPPEKPAYKLDLQPNDKLPNGAIQMLAGDSTPDGDQFYIEQVGVLQPVAITLIADNDGDVLKLVIAKNRWDESIQNISTGPGKKEVTLQFRTQGEVRMIVSAEGPTKPYHLVAWVGKEVLPTLQPVITPMKDYKGPQASTAAGSSSSNGLIAVLLVVVIVLLLVIVVRKRGSK